MSAAALLKQGLELKELKRLEEAADCLQQAIALDPDLAPAHYQLGLIHSIRGSYAEAIAVQQRALAIDPVLAEAHNNIGYCHLSLGDLPAAIAAFRRAVASKPDYARAYYNLAIAAFRQGDLDEAIEAYRSALAADPALVEAHVNLGYLLSVQSRYDEAIRHYEQALALKPELAEILCNLGYAHYQQYRPDEAAACYRQALALNPDLADAAAKLVTALLAQGDHAEARRRLPELLAMKAIPAEACSSLLCALLYSTDCPPATLYAAHRGYAARIETPLIPLWRQHGNTRDPERRLNIGYVSPDLRIHSVTRFLEPILAHHDKGQVEVYCYHSHELQDEVSVRLAGYTDHWIPCKMMSDDELAMRVRSDGIDILVDLAGHTAGNRLPVFARKPAPVQVTYLGYAATTGLSAMDWRLVTAATDPPGAETWHSERLYCLPRSLWCYRPPASAVSLQAPVQRNGYITFGSMNNIAKASPAAMALWGRILHALPGARLLMTNVPAGSIRRRILERLAAQGVAPERIVLHGKLPGPDFLQALGEIDIALDTFPYAGTTTTCEALWLGVPVVSLRGETSVARSGHALLQTLGLEDLAARDEDDYLHIALSLAGDLPRLCELRVSLRRRFMDSPLRDEPGMAQDIESAYRHMWRAWCHDAAA
jgi:predicted O-linked N-acetylglucosamine transferase (SPINDLY family)